ncbi:MAG: hypothetical protein U9R58_08375 [Chloroflexota bacterium]|nr:hypothetical protein [Chloroflexota bacterium]
MKKILRLFLIVNVCIIFLLSACKSADKPDADSQEISPTATTEQKESGYGSGASTPAALAETAVVEETIDAESDFGSTNLPPGVPDPSAQGAYPPPISAYPPPQDVYPPPETSFAQEDLKPLADGSYPAPPTPANPWNAGSTAQDTSSNPYPAPGRESTPIPYPAPGTGGPLDPYPAPESQPQSPQLTSTPIPVQPTPTPFPTRMPVSTRMSATNPDEVELQSGKVQFIEFFAFWDGYSKAMAPIVHGLEASYGEEIKFIYLDIDDPATKELKLMLGYKIQPHFFLVDGDGEIIEEWLGLVDEYELDEAFRVVVQK